VKQNWMMKFLVAGNAAVALVSFYTAYHTATFLFGFPDSPVSRWCSRFSELFPSLSVLPGLFSVVTGRPLLGSAVEGSRLPGVILDVLLGVVAGAIAYGLARYAKWARTFLGIAAALTVVLYVTKLVPIGLHFFAANFQNYLGTLLREGQGPQYTFFGLLISGGIAGLMWKWRQEPEAGSEQSAARPAFPGSSSYPNAWFEARQAKLKKSLWGIRIALPVLGFAVTLNVLVSASSWRLVAAQQVLTLLAWLWPIPLIWYLLSRPDSRLGVGLAVGFAAVQLLPYIGIAGSPMPMGLLFLLGFQTWPRIVMLLASFLATLVVLVCAFVATWRLGRATANSAGKWGTGVLAPFLAALVFYQIALESTFAKSPAWTHEQWSNQSKEYRSGHQSRSIVVSIGKCLFQYAAAHPQEGFPADLDQLGPGGSACLGGEKGPNQIPGYAFLYEASSGLPGGPRDRFVARSKQLQHIPGTFSLPDTLVDETGMVAAMEGDKRGFSFSPELALLHGIAICLKREFDAGGGQSYPRNLHGLLAIKGDYGTPCLPGFQSN